MKILIIDDEQPTLAMFKLLLTAYGHEVLTAESGERGLEILATWGPDMVFTDIRMPGMDGLEVLRQIRESGALCQVIIITGHGDAELAAAATDLGAMFSGREIEEQDARTHCPVCGSLPSISYLDRAPEDQSEFLNGGGGMKFLHCGLCGHDFRTHRHLCPVCHTRDPEHLRYYSADKESGERVDACLNCSTYLPCIDLRKADRIEDMDTAATALLHLDILAREEGFAPMTWTLWNRLE